jgi:hypothetical protein
VTASRVKEQLETILAEVDVARKTAGEDPMGLAEALENALEAYPAFLENASLHDGWAAEVAQILPDHEHVAQITADLAVRQAMIAVRRGDAGGALTILDAANIPNWTVPPRLRAATTRSSALTRLQRLDEAEAPLKEAEALVGQVPYDWPHGRALVRVARAELAVARADASAWELAHQALFATPEDSLEERLQLHQMLALLYVAKGDVNGALGQLHSAREIVEGCGAGVELLQLLLACGGLRLAAGDLRGSNRDFDEALRLAAENPSAELMSLVRIGARDVAATRHAAEAFARRGVLGYMGMIAYLHSRYLDAEELREAYRILATGLAVAKRLEHPGAELVFRALVNRQRDEVMGAAAFDRMVETMMGDTDPDS